MDFKIPKIGIGKKRCKHRDYFKITIGTHDGRTAVIRECRCGKILDSKKLNRFFGCNWV